VSAETTNSVPSPGITIHISFSGWTKEDSAIAALALSWITRFLHNRTGLTAGGLAGKVASFLAAEKAPENQAISKP
jgi:hypothetical protein